MKFRPEAYETDCKQLQAFLISISSPCNFLDCSGKDGSVVPLSPRLASSLPRAAAKLAAQMTAGMERRGAARACPCRPGGTAHHSGGFIECAGGDRQPLAGSARRARPGGLSRPGPLGDPQEISLSSLTTPVTQPSPLYQHTEDEQRQQDYVNLIARKHS